MNTIKRPRKRPRDTSVNFRTLWWLVAYEAAFLVLRRWWAIDRLEPLTRATYAQLWPDTWRRRAEWILRHHVVDGRIG